MIETIATIDILNLAIDKIDDGKVEDAKDDLITFRDKLQNEVDEFDKWAKVQSDIDTSLQLEIESEQGKWVIDYRGWCESSILGHPRKNKRYKNPYFMRFFNSLTITSKYDRIYRYINKNNKGLKYDV